MVKTNRPARKSLGEARLSQGAGAVRGGEVFVELVGERAVVAGFGDVVPRWWIRGEEGVAACSSWLERRRSAKPVVEEYTRQRIGEAEGNELDVMSKDDD